MRWSRKIEHFVAEALEKERSPEHVPVAADLLVGPAPLLDPLLHLGEEAPVVDVQRLWEDCDIRLLIFFAFEKVILDRIK